MDGNGEVSLEPLADLNAPVGSRAAVPIDLGAGRDDVFLGLVGTGIRGWRSEVNATVAGQDIHVDHAQAHPEWPGLDWIVLGPLPRSLTRSGEPEVVLIVDGHRSNSVTVAIQ